MILVHRGRVICDAGTSNSHRGIGHVHPVYAEDDANGRLPRAQGRLQVLAVDPVVLQHMRHCRRVSFERNADHAFARPGALHAASCGRASTQQVPREVRDGRLHLRQRNVYVTVEDFASSELSLGGGDDCIRGRVAGATGASAAWSQM